MKGRSFDWQLVAMLVVTLVLSACGLAGSEDASKTSQVESEPPGTLSTPVTGPAKTLAPDGSASATDVQSGQAASSEADTSVPDDFGAMLDSMGDYQIEVNVSFEGRDQAGISIAFQWHSRESVTTDPPRSRLDLEAVRGNEQSGIESMTLVRDGDTGYLYVPSVGCISGSAGEEAANMRLPLDTASLLNGITGTRAVGTGIVVNGVETTEFQLDETNVPWSPSGPWSITGNAFVEEGSSVISRIMLSVSGNGDLLGNGRMLDGDYTIIINVMRSKANETVAIPSACVGAFIYPVTPDAYDVTAIEDLLSYRSRGSLVDVVGFYLSEMPSGGWQLLSEPDVFDDLAIMNYRRDGAPLMITVEYDAETDTVSVLISP